ncbi:hypothetical protein F971_02574 [Acinetobacter vivianii]|uniref:Uncharacterized protein n=1 Tax=Acinetobacter vivianii TaxID=1776742 RepID=N8W7Z6_9GAMM|nr:hypothetical protein [Acinetobacter vivianii]ENU91482.1 hypothetical protein F971_02574 [Acinetobacter vivianii]
MKKVITGVLLAITSTYALASQDKYVKYRLTYLKNVEMTVVAIPLEYKNISEAEKPKVEEKCFLEIRSEEAKKLFKKITGNQNKKFIYTCNIDL